ncbi:MAG: glutamate--tRNA ligase [Clostridiales bacterium]|nr:glutamate--tRNA ligase [Clostridiales bacterium]
MDNKELAARLFPDVEHEPQYYLDMYPERNLPEGAIVTRFAPSPTGFVHIGGLYASLVAERIAHQSGGVFFLRIEDTDQKRTVENGVQSIIDVLKDFDVNFDEGAIGENGADVGNYGPYTQTKRAEIYRTFAKKLVEEGKAYPCFCSAEKLDMDRKRQEAVKIRTGYYGDFATCRNLSNDEIEAKLNAGEKFVIRMRSMGVNNKKIVHKDLIRGKVEFPENDIDQVIIKSDGIPTYHFAHVIDDHLMHTTYVTRGDEWLSSVPVHLQMFRTMGWEPPKYAHFSTIMKKEGETKRKLSKRKDSEAAVTYYFEEGYPNISVNEYLLNIANSTFEPWRRSNPTIPYTEFNVKLGDMSASGSLFDLIKLTDISKDVISKMSGEEVYDRVIVWAEKFDKQLYDLLTANKEYAVKIFSIEKGGKKPRKDIAKWSDVRDQVSYFYPEIFDNKYEWPENISEEDRKAIIDEYLATYDYNDDKQAWFDKIKAICDKLGFASNNKDYKENPEKYKGNVSDVSNVIRVALTGRQMSPDMYEIMQVMGDNMTRERIGKR